METNLGGTRLTDLNGLASSSRCSEYSSHLATTPTGAYLLLCVSLQGLGLGSLDLEVEGEAALATWAMGLTSCK